MTTSSGFTQNLIRSYLLAILKGDGLSLLQFTPMGSLGDTQGCGQMGLELAGSVKLFQPVPQTKTAVFQRVPDDSNLVVLVCYFV
jgi:hypothetical protein